MSLGKGREGISGMEREGGMEGWILGGFLVMGLVLDWYWARGCMMMMMMDG